MDRRNTVDFHSVRTYAHLLGDGMAALGCVLVLLAFDLQ
jgi:hypothetical protein